MYKNILLPVDLNHESSWQKSLPVALGLCGSFSAKLHVMTVVPDFGSAYVAGFFPADFEQKALDQTQAALAKFVDGNVPDGVEIQQMRPASCDMLPTAPCTRKCSPKPAKLVPTSSSWRLTAPNCRITC